MGLHPPDDPFLINTAIFGIPIVVRWYGIFVIGGALLGAWLAASRAKQRGYDPDHTWNQLILGLVMGIIGARIYYVIFEWSRYEGDFLAMINITAGGLAIHGAIIGAILSALLYTTRNKTAFLGVDGYPYAGVFACAGDWEVGQLLQPRGVWPPDCPA